MCIWWPIAASKGNPISFFYNETKAEAKPKAAKKPGRRADIPIASLQTLGCSVCPRDKDTESKSPKLKPSGVKSPIVYLLGGSPSIDEDADHNHWTDKAGAAIYSKFGYEFMKLRVRSNFITQCLGEQTVVEIECCRLRIVADIEASKPRVIVGIGDGPLAWATGAAGGALAHRGSYFAVKIGTHVCWYYPILYPNYVNKKSYKKSEYELTLEHDIANLKLDLDSLPAPEVWTGHYDVGIELITGDEPNDLIKLEKTLKELAKEVKSAVDIETNGLRPFMLGKDAKILSIAVGTFKRTVAFPVDHPDGWGTEARRKRVKALLLDYLLESGRKACHNLAFEMEWFAFYFGSAMLRRTEWDDTMAQGHTLDERPGTKSLDLQVNRAFGFRLKALSNIDTKRLLEYPLKDVLLYNARDTKWTDKLRDYLAPKIEAVEAYAIEYERKVRLAPTMVQTEVGGLPADLAYAKKQADRLNATTADLEARIKRCPEVKEYSTRFGTFSPTNPDHVLKMLKEISRRDEIRVEEKRGKTTTVRWTTDEEALSKIPAGEVPSVPLILEHRGSSKLVSTYIQPVLDKRIVCPDGLMRSKYSSMVAVTGRLASEDPNIQNWPARKNKEIRGIVKAPEGSWIVACDYGQIEFRVVGMASEDPNLVKYCWTGYDVHKFWAERAVALFPSIKDWIVAEFQVDWDEKGLKTLRQEMKNKWVFPQLFGSSVKSCAEQLHLPEDTAGELAAEFWDEFPVVKKWQDKLVARYEKNLYVETLGGRRRRGPMTRNELINMPIQGTAFDIVVAGYNAISELADVSEDDELQPRIIIHDDLTFIMTDASLETKIPVIAREMCLPRFDYVNVPLVVEVKAGKRWHDLEEIEVYRSHLMFDTPNPYA